jgi:hypothetical protein
MLVNENQPWATNPTYLSDSAVLRVVQGLRPGPNRGLLLVDLSRLARRLPVDKTRRL